MRYCACFCEENVWHLCQDASVRVPKERRRVVFVSNPARRVAMRHQQAGRGGVIFWDYHVVLITPGVVWDLDTTLGFPVPARTWLDESFPPLAEPPRFRVVDAATYVETFASDRSHMLTAPHPAWPIIGTGMNLMRFVDMEAPFVGTVVGLEEMGELCG